MTDVIESLEGRRISVRFDGLIAIDDVSITVPRGRILGLIGPNGAGKTTLVNVLTGFQKPAVGQITVAGRDVTGWPPHRLGRNGVARTFQSVRLFRALSVLENVAAAAIGAGLSRR